METRSQTMDVQEDGSGGGGEEEEEHRDGSSSHRDLTVKVDGKSSGDQKATTPRSKHSATEQLRRSKINERFQILRELLPPSDQKRDKASFLLEVIEYIQILHEKVNKYEGSYGWDQEPVKYMRWRSSHGPAGSLIDHSRLMKNGSGPGLIYPGKLNDGSIGVATLTPENAHITAESEQRMAVPYKPVDPQGLADKTPIPDGENIATQPQVDQWQNLPCTTDCPTNTEFNDPEEFPVEGGQINISTAYSQGLLNNLTQALQSVGVDLSQASMSVQIDLGKRAFNRMNCATSNVKRKLGGCMQLTRCWVYVAPIYEYARHELLKRIRGSLLQAIKLRHTLGLQAVGRSRIKLKRG